MTARGMQRVLARMEERTAAFGREPFQRFLEDPKLSPDERLSFAFGLTHFVMSFADVCTLVLREEPPKDRYQELVNQHAQEDCDHYRWFLQDLRALGYDPPVRLTDAVRLLWGPELERSRVLTYRLCHLGYRATPLRKLVLIYSMEATADVGIRNTARIARTWMERHGERLVYFSADHVTAEEGHQIRTDDVVRMLAETSIDDATADELTWVVDESFDAFTEFTAELLRFPGTPAERTIRQ